MYGRDFLFLLIFDGINFSNPVWIVVLICFQVSFCPMLFLRRCNHADLAGQHACIDILCGACLRRFTLIDISMRAQLWSLIPSSSSVLFTLSWMLVAISSSIFFSLVGTMTSWTRPFSSRRALNSSCRFVCWNCALSSISFHSQPGKSEPLVWLLLSSCYWAWASYFLRLHILLAYSLGVVNSWHFIRLIITVDRLMVWSATTELQTLSVPTELTVSDPLATKAWG